MHPVGEPPQSDGRRTPAAEGVFRRSHRLPAPRPHYHCRGRVSTARLMRAMKTYEATPTDRERNWLLVDASGQTLRPARDPDRRSSARQGKPTYTPHIDTGEIFVVVSTRRRSRSPARSSPTRRYYRHSGYPGGLLSRTLGEMLQRRPEEVIRLAVKEMMPRNRLARKQLTKLKVYAGPEHPHAAQQPQPMEIAQ